MTGHYIGAVVALPLEGKGWRPTWRLVPHSPVRSVTNMATDGMYSRAASVRSSIALRSSSGRDNKPGVSVTYWQQVKKEEEGGRGGADTSICVDEIRQEMNTCIERERNTDRDVCTSIAAQQKTDTKKRFPHETIHDQGHGYGHAWLFDAVKRALLNNLEASLTLLTVHMRMRRSRCDV
jgi:hypothetical protein